MCGEEIDPSKPNQVYSYLICRAFLIWVEWDHKGAHNLDIAHI